MADEEAAEAEATPATAPAEGGGKDKSKLLIIIIAVILILGAGGGAAFYFLVLPKMIEADKPAESKDATVDAESEAQMASLGSTAELPPFIVNLSGGTGRYLKVAIVLKLSTDKVSEEISNRQPQIKDAVITVLSSKAPEEILTVQGKYDLKGEIMKRINVFLTTGVVRELYFVEFVVQ